jgi:hypothetical protein
MVMIIFYSRHTSQDMQGTECSTTFHYLFFKSNSIFVRKRVADAANSSALTFSFYDFFKTE